MSVRLRIYEFIQNYIRRIKGDSIYTIDSNIKITDLIFLVIKRFSQRLRGLCRRFLGVNSGGNMFLGRNVYFDHRNHLKVGKNVIIEDNVYINALGKDGIIIGNDVTIQRNSILIVTGVIQNIGKGIIIHDNVGINSGAYLGGQGGITIGRNVIIGPGVNIFSENHVFEDVNQLIKKQGESRMEVHIQEDCWIGSGSTILAGVTIGKGSVVAAGAVVNKSFPEFSVIGGVPAKLIKSRV